MVSLLHTYVISICCFYSYIRITNFKVDKMSIIILAMISLAISVLMYIFADFLPTLRYIIVFIIMSATIKMITKHKFDLTISAMLISSGVGYGLNLISMILSSALLYYFFKNDNIFIKTFFMALLQLFITFTIFKYHRFKNGFAFLNAKWWSPNVGLLLVSIIFIAIIIISNERISDDMATGFIIGATICAGLIFIWGLISLNNQYRIHQYEKIREEDAEAIAELQRINEQLSKINHSDNKILPSVYNAVNQFLIEVGSELSPEYQNTGNTLLSELEQLINFRAENMHDNIMQTSLPKTGIYLVDSLLNYMSLKALSKEIGFEVKIDVGSIDNMKRHISGAKLETLLAELIDNAIIATGTSKYRSIQVAFNDKAGYSELCVSDSGESFDKTVLEKLGVEQVTTHIDTGGSGIGYITIFEIIRDTKASFFLEPNHQNEKYDKSVMVRFDGKNLNIIT